MIGIEDNPSIQANKVRRFIVRGLRDESLTLFEAYQLHCEALRIDRIAYTQSAWGRRLSISGLLFSEKQGESVSCPGRPPVESD